MLGHAVMSVGPEYPTSRSPRLAVSRTPTSK